MDGKTALFTGLSVLAILIVFYGIRISELSM